MNLKLNSFLIIIVVKEFFTQNIKPVYNDNITDEKFAVKYLHDFGYLSDLSETEG